MKKTPSDPADAAALRRRAEEKLQGKQKGRRKEMGAWGEQLEAQRLVHELQVHQIELEMQNDEMRRALSEIEESRARYLNLYDFSPIGYFTFDRESRIKAVNLTGASLLGTERQSLIKAPFPGFLYRDSLPVFSSHMEQVFTSGVKQTCELWLMLKNRNLLPVIMESILTEPAEGLPVQSHSAMIDISKRKQAEKTLRDRTADLEVSNKELETFCYSVSHDLRAPLRAIDGYSRMILKKEGNKFDEDTARKFNDIRSNAQMMGNLIDDILELSRLGRLHMSMVNLEMEGIIKDVWKELQTINPERHMTLTIRSMPSGYGDRTLIKQVYANLLANAVKFTKYKNPAQIEAGGYIGGDDHILYYVKDNGTGFDMAYYDKLFGLFQRLHNDSDFEGMGVGLTIIQRIVHRHGGRVWAEGKVNEGATFYFSLPPVTHKTIDGETLL